MGKSKKVIADVLFYLGDFFSRFDNSTAAWLYGWLMHYSDKLDPWKNE